MSEENYSYRALIYWQKAMQFAKLVYLELKKFPSEERYAMCDQIRRAAVSVPSNIAEGSGRSSNKDYAHFLSIARGSLYETMTQLELAVSLGYIESIPAEIESLHVELRRLLTSQIKRYIPFSNSNSNSNPPLSNSNSHSNS